MNLTAKEKKVLAIIQRRYRSTRSRSRSKIDLSQICNAYYPDMSTAPMHYRSSMAATLRALCLKSLLAKDWSLTKATGVGRGHIAQYEYHEE